MIITKEPRLSEILFNWNLLDNFTLHKFTISTPPLIFLNYEILWVFRTREIDSNVI